MLPFFNGDFEVCGAVVDIDDDTGIPQLHLDIFENDQHHCYQRRMDQITPPDYFMLLGMIADADHYMVSTFIRWFKSWQPETMTAREKMEYENEFNPLVIISDCKL